MAYVPPRTGEFRHNFSVERKTNATDGTGGTVGFVTFLPKVYGAVREERGGEEVRAARLSGISRHDVTFRACKDTQAITSGDRLVKTVTRVIVPDIVTTNYNFENGLSGWFDNSSAAANYNGTSLLPARVENYQLAPVVVQNSLSVPRIARGTPITIRQGRKYRVRARYFCTLANVRIDVGAALFNASGVYQTVQRTVINVPANSLNQWVEVSVNLTGTDTYATMAPLLALNNNSASGAIISADRCYIEDYTDEGAVTRRAEYDIKWVGDIEGRGRFVNLYCESGGLGDAF